MTERVLPEQDRYATCPADGVILDYYAGVFEAVFILLHPFIKPISIGLDVFQPSTYPDRKSIVANCKPVFWSEVMSLANFSSLSEIDIGIRTLISGLKAEYARPEYADRLDDLYENQQIIAPSEGVFSDLTHDLMLGFLQDSGHDWVWVGDEFCTERKLYWIEDLKGKAANATLGHCNVFPPDKSFLWTTHWDSCCSFVCGSRELLESLKTRQWAEGFFCSERTCVYWGLHET